MSSNDRTEAGAEPSCHFPDDSQELVDLVDGAVKALSIGGSLQSADEMRQAVDELKHQLGTEPGSQ